MPSISYPQAVWRGASATSDPVKIGTATVTGFHIPSTFTGTSVTFLVSNNGEIDGTFRTMTDDTGVTITYTVAASRYVRAKPTDFAGIGCFKIVSSATESASTTVRASVREIS